MAYLVKITSRAERDLVSLYIQINAASSGRAQEWYRGLRSEILGISEMPYRHPVTPETRRLRHMLYGHKPNVYRVIFQVRKKQRRIEVLHIRHGARRKFTASDLK